MDHSLIVMKGLAKLSEAISHAVQGHQDKWVIMESSDKTWSTGEGNGKPFQYSYLENLMNSMKRQKDMTPKDEPPGLEGVQYATGEVQRGITNCSRKNEAAGSKWKQHSVMDVFGGENKVCKEQYFLGTWNIRSMNQDKLDVVKQEMARVNINILGTILDLI